MLIPLFVLIAAATIIYPFFVYTNLEAWGPGPLAWVLLVLLIARVVLRGEYRQPEQYAQFLFVGSLCTAAAWLESEQLLRFYPVAMSLSFAGFFWLSLSTNKPLIERFAGMRNSTVFGELERGYMRQLTKVWAALLFANALVASYTACCMSLQSWTLYNGLLAYVFFGLFSLGELVYRHYYKKRHQLLSNEEG